MTASSTKTRARNGTRNSAWHATAHPNRGPRAVLYISGEDYITGKVKMDGGLSGMPTVFGRDLPIINDVIIIGFFFF